jgi:hypothetical protein
MFVVFLCACSEKKEIKPKIKNISFVAKITYYNEKYSLNTIFDSEGNMKASVLEPDDYKDLSFEFKDNKVTAEYLGLTYTPQKGNLAVNNVAGIIYSAFNDTAKISELTVKNGENCKTEGEIEGKKYILSFSPAGLPLSLELPKDGYKAEFNELTLR